MDLSIEKCGHGSDTNIVSEAEHRNFPESVGTPLPQQPAVSSSVVKSLMRKIKGFLGNPFIIVPLLGWKHRLKWMPDSIYLRLYYRAYYGKWPNLKKPKLYSEKLQYLKLKYRKPLLTELVDKLAVRDYVSKKVGSKYLVPLLGTWSSFDEIPFAQLPDAFVIKCNHDCGGYYICADKDYFNVTEAKSKIDDHLSRNYYWGAREWPYKDVKPCVLAEHFLLDSENGKNKAITDYKFFCFDGLVHSVMVCMERETALPKFYFFDREWKLLRINVRGLQASPDFTVAKPLCIDEMFTIASKLSAGLPFVRVDLYAVGTSVYFGEMTLLPTAGFDSNLLEETDRLWGTMINLEKFC